MSSEKTDATFDVDGWVEGLVQASKGLDPVPADRADVSVIVEFKFGKGLSAIAALEAGRFTGLAGKAEVSLTLPVTVEQIDGYCTGAQSMSVDYMRGDLKPAGSTGQFIALLDVFENPEFVSGLPDRA